MSLPSPSRIQTRSQQLAELAFKQVSRHDSLPKKRRDEYVGFAKRFPSLVHSCGLAQAVAFAQSKAPDDYLNDLRAVMSSGTTDVAAFAADIRTAELARYLQLSRTALQAAGWLKRYAEALLDFDSMNSEDK